jgi:hypothetical protein
MRLNIKGIPVKLSVRTQTGIDDFNRPTYEVSQEVVENVLVGEPSAEDVVNELNLSGKRIVYTLAIPKGDTHMGRHRGRVLRQKIPHHRASNRGH